MQVSISVSAELGELAVFVSGRTADVWWPPEVGFPHPYVLERPLDIWRHLMALHLLLISHLLQMQMLKAWLILQVYSPILAQLHRCMIPGHISDMSYSLMTTALALCSEPRAAWESEVYSLAHRTWIAAVLRWTVGALWRCRLHLRSEQNMAKHLLDTPAWCFDPPVSHT